MVTSTGSVARPSTVPSTSSTQQAIDTFLSELVSAARSTGAVLRADLPVDAATCRCALSVAVSVGGDAYAVAQRGVSSTAGSGGSGGAGSTGAATTVSVSGRGPASATSVSGDVGGEAGAPPTGSGGQPSEVTGGDGSDVAGDVEGLVGTLLTANGAAAMAVDNGDVCAQGSCASAVDIQVAASSGCESVTGSPCTLAVAVAIGGTAHASAISAGGANQAPAAAGCGSGSAGSARAISISVSGAARAAATRGATPACAQTTSPGARSGDTGAVLGVALAGDGASLSSATSGDSGSVLMPQGAQSGEPSIALTGNTGAAVGIAIARHGAITLVHSGSSGVADSICTNCGGAAAPAGGTAIAVAASGDTGISYSLAIAGETASVRSASGGSGRSIAWTIQGAPGTGNPSGKVVVKGRSGTTGDTVVVAVGLDSWVDVWTYTGQSGPVLSTGTWGVSGCTFVVATLTARCAGQVRPPPGMPAGSSSGGPGTTGGSGVSIGPPGSTGTVDSTPQQPPATYDLPAAAYVRLSLGPAPSASILVPLTAPTRDGVGLDNDGSGTPLALSPTPVSDTLPRTHSNLEPTVVLLIALAALLVAACLMARHRGRQHTISRS
ncbi:MAG: hypothetical protein ACRDWT_18450 [Jatrophihabitantaceae bacterium]